jgi:hypothetical protein
VKLSSGLELQVKGLSELSNSGEIDLFIPLAFGTQDKLKNYGLEKYLEINNRLINFHEDIILGCEISRTITISSGIVRFNKSELDRPDAFWIYKDLKKLEEDVLSEALSNKDVTHIACRLFSITGSEMIDPLKYAVGNMIVQAHEKKSISIHSSKPVFRKYVDAQSLCKLLVLLSEGGQGRRLDSTGTLIEVSDLATTIANTLNLSSENIICPENDGSNSDIYYSTDESMENFFLDYRIESSSIEDQILNTYRGLIESGYVKQR